MSAPVIKIETAGLARALENTRFFRVIVPSLTARGQRLLSRRWVPAVLDVILPITGGATELPAFGHWVNNGRSVREHVVLIDAYVPRRLDRPTAFGLALAFEALAARMEQDALAVAVEHQLWLLRPVPVQQLKARAAARRRLLARTVTNVPASRGRVRMVS